MKQRCLVSSQEKCKSFFYFILQIQTQLSLQTLYPENLRTSQLCTQTVFPCLKVYVQKKARILLNCKRRCLVQGPKLTLMITLQIFIVFTHVMCQKFKDLVQKNLSIIHHAKKTGFFFMDSYRNSFDCHNFFCCICIISISNANRITNMKYWARNERIINSTLQLLSDLSIG